MIDINSLSLEEKILQTKVAQMKKGEKITEQVGAAFFFGEIITEAEEGGIEELRGYVKDLYANAKIPPFITSDFENGCGSMVKCLTPLPYLMGLGASNDEKLAYDYGKATALEACSVGANWTYSPVADLNINKRNPLVNVRSVSDNPDVASRLLKQVVKGMQENGLSACAKHFPGDGLDWRDQHIVTTNNTLSFDDWKKKSGRVFKELIDSGVDTIMAGHITLPSYQKERDEEFNMPYPATLSKELITGLLKNEMGFKGIVVTDALGMGGINGWYESRERTEIEAFKAGCDMMLWPTENYVENMKKAIETGYISVERLNDAVERIIRTKEKAGLFDKNRPMFKDLTAEEKQFVKDTQEKVSLKSMTLIRDTVGNLPLNKGDVKKILVIPVINYEPAFKSAEHLCDLIRQRNVEVVYKPYITPADFYKYTEECDRVIFAMFSRSFKPVGFLDYYERAASTMQKALNNGRKKTIGVSFGSPYFFKQFFERSCTFVNAYSMLDCAVEAFVKCAFGEEKFNDFSPAEL
ncbi:glycoside hydrolase family 3 protein [Qingrenia yutianensis]|uniref:beta-N-acetylhexosaminidase n=1 Tax=Qingrenia yutianensis TaxID=2763676 RepID=A0A926FBN4_9FIRM|nr:glycoside hydrolase family 3 N-terminal domain-containing protein [Qingrenia yutianensis]MBC8595404.1 glycoside hydrolase family 3 protein [Qingrenia yutianensis]